MFKFLEHTSDELLYVEAGNFKNAVSDLANGMIYLMETKSDEKSVITVQYKNEKLEDFVVRLLEKIIAEIETRPFHPVRAEVLEAKEKPYYAKIKLYGEKKTPPNPIKAVTYHMLIAKKEKGKYIFRVLFDI
ncbi:MAG: archease [Candidatus Anstonellales archaeon]